MKFPFAVLATVLALTAPLSSAHAKCGGDFSQFVQGLAAEAETKGFEPSLASRFFANVRQDKKVLGADRAQGVFQKELH